MSDELVRIKYANRLNRNLEHAPVTYGVPLRQGLLEEDGGLAVRAEDGSLLPVQTKPLEAWPDGSIKWLLLDVELPAEANENGEIALVRADAQPAERVVVDETDATVTVRTAVLEATFDRSVFSLFASYRAGGEEMMLDGSDIVVEQPLGKRFRASDAKDMEVRVLEDGPVRAVVQVSGKHTAGDGSTFLDFRVRYTFHVHEPGVMVAYTFTNREEPETGVKAGSIRIEVPTALGKDTEKLLRQCNSGEHWYSRRHVVRENVEIIASSSQNEAAKNRYGNAADGRIVVRDLSVFRENPAEYPHYLRPGNARTDMTGGLRAAYSYLGLRSDRGSAMAFFLGMDFNFPKGLRADRNCFTFDVWPAWAGEMHVRRGQSKEHSLFIALTPESLDEETLENIYFRHETGGYGIWGSTSGVIDLTLDPEYVRDVGILDLHRWLRWDPSRYTLVELKLGSMGGGKTPAQRGMWDCGDFINPDRSWAHNNENDAILNLVREYYRRGEASSLSAATAKAMHNAHVDFIAYDPDPLRQGTMPAHCPEHTDGATYPSHMWVDGLLAVYCVTGEPDLLEAAVSVGENMRRWQEAGEIFYTDSRESGWPMLAWLRLHEQTGEQRWLDYVDEAFRYYRERIPESGRILYELPHGVGTSLSGYGEFILWRALFFYYERTGREDVKEFLVDCLDKVYFCDPASGAVGGWACNDLFPAWAAYTLTGEDRYIEDNYPFFTLMMKKQGNFSWGGVDVHYYLNELDRRGVLEDFQ